MTVLAASGLTGGYTKAHVLRDVSITVDGAEIVACFGRNGAGKTTLLRALSGTLPVCSGTIMLDERRIDRAATWTRAQLGVAHVPEGRHVFGAMSVRENLLAGALASKTPAALDEVYDLFPRLGDRRDQRADTLSGGEQQMVAIGRALMSSPRAMLIDEMSAGLAPALADRLVDGLVRIRERGVAILLVEQAPHIVADVIDRAYLLELGCLVGEGTLDKLGGASGIADRYLGVRAAPD